MRTLEDILKDAYEQNASDVHLRSNDYIWIRIDGILYPSSNRPLTTEDDIKKLLMPIIPENKLENFNKSLEIDFAWEIKDMARFRINIFREINGISACIRILPSAFKNVNDLKIESGILELCSRKKGLILVTGPTGSGKSTTLAALLDYINILNKGHIITIEDPIEFILKEKNSIITQREINSHTENFSGALRATLREDPNCVMIGEMRDLETTMTALEVAETGHLVLSSLHTNNAAATVYRIINQFPSKVQDQVRMSLASSLIGVVSQLLIPRKDGKGRIAAKEILLVNHAVANLIRENKIYQINNVIQTGRNQGMIKMSDSLMNLIKSNIISERQAYECYPDKSMLTNK
ncbi:MAG: hypothetical protein ACD_79C00821G0008 [uncultured bacterium]|nr:MAG: hypothetical protein ACD_79C00821G0008 [uncultured bacterium]